MTATIRPAVAADCPAIANLIRELAVYEKLEHEAQATAEDLVRHLFGDRPMAEALVVEDGGEPVGFALYFSNFSTFRGQPGIYLEDLFVKPSHRGRGLGKALLARLASIAVDRGCGRFEWSVLDWNAPAIGFYRGLGARPMDDWTVFRLDGDSPLPPRPDGPRPAMSSSFLPHIDRMAGYAPGEQPREGGFIKLNTNENPYPPSPRVAEAVATALDGRLRRYPDPMGTAFREVAARKHGVEADQVLVGNGSDDLLTILTRSFAGPGDVVVYPTPSYVLYRTLAEIQGATPVEVAFGSDWSMDADRFAIPGAKLAFLANPNSPSGTRLPSDQVAALASRLSCPLVVDEAYADFAEGDCVGLVADHANVVVTRTLSKGSSLAGLRVGYLIARPSRRRPGEGQGLLQLRYAQPRRRGGGAGGRGVSHRDPGQDLADASPPGRGDARARIRRAREPGQLRLVRGRAARARRVRRPEGAQDPRPPDELPGPRSGPEDHGRDRRRDRRLPRGDGGNFVVK